MSGFYVSPFVAVVLRAKADTDDERAAVDRLERYLGDGRDMGAAMLIALRAGFTEIAKLLGHAAPQHAQLVAKVAPDSAAKLALIDGAILAHEGKGRRPGMAGPARPVGTA